MDLIEAKDENKEPRNILTDVIGAVTDTVEEWFKPNGTHVFSGTPQSINEKSRRPWQANRGTQPMACNPWNIYMLDTIGLKKNTLFCPYLSLTKMS